MLQLSHTVILHSEKLTHPISQIYLIGSPFSKIAKRCYVTPPYCFAILWSWIVCTVYRRRSWAMGLTRSRCLVRVWPTWTWRLMGQSPSPGATSTTSQGIPANNNSKYWLWCNINNQSRYTSQQQQEISSLVQHQQPVQVLHPTTTVNIVFGATSTTSPARSTNNNSKYCLWCNINNQPMYINQQQQ